MAALGEVMNSDAGPLIDDYLEVKLQELKKEWCVHQNGTAKYPNLPGTDDLPPCASSRVLTFNSESVMSKQASKEAERKDRRRK